MESHLRIYVFLAFAICNAVSMVLSPGCDFNGTTYKVGETYQPRPCDICTCGTEGARCATNNCFYYVRCADPLPRDPAKCCPECPNGDNCKAPDGHIIKRGGTYTMKSGSACHCEETFFGLYGGLAVCT